jgi:MFS family permease
MTLEKSHQPQTEDSSDSRPSPRRNTSESTVQPTPSSTLAGLAPSPVEIDGGYGWVVTVSVALINGHSWGISSVYSVFLAHFIANDTFPGATKLQYALVGSLAAGCTLLISPLVVVAVRKVGTRPTMLAGAVAQSFGLVCAGLSTAIWQLFLSQGVLFGLGMGLLFLPSYGVISQWFTRRRALANGVAIAGAGLGGFAYSLAVGAIIGHLGVAWAYRILAIVSAVVNVACACLVRTRYAAAARPLAFDWSLLRREFLVILGYGVLSMLGYFVLIFTLANYANVIGLDATQAAWIPALFMLGQAIGRSILGWLSDVYGHIQVTSFMSLLCGVFSLAIWLNAESFGVLVAFALVAGLVGGVFWVTTAPIVAQVVGLDKLPSGLAIVWVTIAIPSTFSSSIALEIFEETGSYTGAQIFTGMTYIAAGLCAGYLWRLQLVE